MRQFFYWFYFDFIKNIPLSLAFFKRDIEVQHQRFIAFFMWSFIQDGLFFLVFYTLKKSLQLSIDSTLPFAIYLILGFFVWNFFSKFVNYSARLLKESLSIRRQMYISYLVLMFSKILFIGFERLVSFVFIVFFLFFFHVDIDLSRLIFLFLALFWLIIVSFGFGFFVCFLCGLFRDFSQIFPVLMSLLFFMTPIFYDSKRLYHSLGIISILNPLISVLELMRWSLSTDIHLQYSHYIIYSGIFTTFLFIIGIGFIYQYDKKILDYL